MQAKLRATGTFTTVDTFDASGGTPTSSQLATYDAVLFFGAYGPSDPAALGDRLAAYHDQGGGVAVVGLANCGGYSVQGAWGNHANGYALLDYTSCVSNNQRVSNDSLGDLLEPQSPLLAGVASFSAYLGEKTTASIINGGVVVAKWKSGPPLVVRGARRGRTLVELTFYAPSNEAMSGYWSGDGAVLMRNALKYSRCMLCGPGTYLTGEARRKSFVTWGDFHCL